MTSPGRDPSRPRETESVPEVFRRMAEESFAPGGSPLYARLAREHADDPLVAEIAGDHEPRWEIPLRLFGGVHYLALAGEAEDAWTRFGTVLAEHREWLTRFVTEQPVQTNEVQRCWALVPAFLTVVDGRPIDLVELGPSGGLNLLWDRYRYDYGGIGWGSSDARLELTGRASPGPPRSLFTRTAEVAARVGIDKAPVDVTTKEGALLLQCFVWADQAERLERLRRAIEVVRDDPPTLIAGDYVEVVPELLAGRSLDRLTVVFHSASTAYLRDAERERLRDAIEAAGRHGSLAWVSYEFDEDDAREEKPVFEGFTLDVQLWPGGAPRRLARLDGHGNRMRWLGDPP